MNEARTHNFWQEKYLFHKSDEFVDTFECPYGRVYRDYQLFVEINAKFAFDKMKRNLFYPEVHVKNKFRAQVCASIIVFDFTENINEIRLHAIFNCFSIEFHSFVSSAIFSRVKQTN